MNSYLMDQKKDCRAFESSAAHWHLSLKVSQFLVWFGLLLYQVLTFSVFAEDGSGLKKKKWSVLLKVSTVMKCSGIKSNGSPEYWWIVGTLESEKFYLNSFSYKHMHKAVPHNLMLILSLVANMKWAHLCGSECVSPLMCNYIVWSVDGAVQTSALLGTHFVVCP